jgi:hypothetical protein
LDVVDVDRAVGKRRCVIDCKSELLKGAVVELFDADEVLTRFEPGEVQPVDVIAGFEDVGKDPCDRVSELLVIDKEQDSLGVGGDRFLPTQADDVAGLSSAVFLVQLRICIGTGRFSIVELYGLEAAHIRASTISSAVSSTTSIAGALLKCGRCM